MAASQFKQLLIYRNGNTGVGLGAPLKIIFSITVIEGLRVINLNPKP